MGVTVIINLLSAIPQKEEETKLINETARDFINQNKALTNESVFSFIILSSKLGENFVITINKINKGVVETVAVLPHMTDIGDPNTLEAILLQVKALIMGEITNLILVCWGHGMGYSLFNKITIDDKMLSNFDLENILWTMASDTKEKSDLWQRGLVLNVTQQNFILPDKQSDEKRGVTALTINELAGVLDKIKLNFDLIILDNCFMQTIDTLYALGHRTNFLMSAQTTIPWQSYFYQAFNKLNTKIDTVFCRTFAEESEMKLEALRKLAKGEDKKWYDYRSFSCIDTKNLDNYLSNFEDILNYIYANYKEINLAQCLVDALFKSYDLSSVAFKKDEGLSLIDLNIFLDILESMLKSNEHPELKSKITKNKNFFEKILISNKVTDKLQGKSSGLSICFPDSFDKLEKHIYYSFFLKEDAQVKTRFARLTSWGIFIKRFLLAIR